MRLLRAAIAPILLFLISAMAVSCNSSSVDGGRPAEKAPSFDSASSFTFDDARGMLTLLKENKFEALEDAIDKAENAYSLSHLKEHDAYMMWWKSFQFAQPELRPHYDKWVDARPASAYARFARGEYLHAMALSLIGNGGLRFKSLDQLADYFSFIDRAKDDVLKAIELRPTMVNAYIEMIYVASHFEPPREAITAIAEKALSINPYSFYVRSALIKGGPYSIMSVTADEVIGIIESARPYFAMNPRLRSLEGRPFVQYGDAYLHNKKYDDAIKYYDKALAFGPSTHVYYSKAIALRALDRHGEAIASCTNAIDIDPFSYTAIIYRGIAYYETNNVMNAFTDAQMALELDPRNTQALDLKGVLLEVQLRYEEALEEYRLAMEVSPSNVDYRMRAASLKKKIEERAAGKH